jgi:hypothetical protein
VPRVVSAIAVTLALSMTIAFLLVLLSTPVSLWLGRASEVGALLQQKLKSMSQPLAVLEEVRKALNAIGAGVGSGSEPTLKVEQQSEAMVTTISSIVTPGLLTFPTLGEAVVAPAIFLAIVSIEGQFLTPAQRHATRAPQGHPPCSRA